MAFLKTYAVVVFVLAEKKEDEKEECAVIPTAWIKNIDKVSSVLL